GRAADAARRHATLARHAAPGALHWPRPRGTDSSVNGIATMHRRDSSIQFFWATTTMQLSTNTLVLHVDAPSYWPTWWRWSLIASSVLIMCSCRTPDPYAQPPAGGHFQSMPMPQDQQARAHQRALMGGMP